MENYFEIKIRMMNADMAMKLMAPLSLGTPEREDRCSYEVVVGSQPKQVLQFCSHDAHQLSVRKQGAGFVIASSPLDDATADEARARHPQRKTFHADKKIWHVGHVLVCLVTVESLGVFLELHGKDLDALKQIARTIGFSEHHYLTRTYDEIV